MSTIHLGAQPADVSASLQDEGGIEEREPKDVGVLAQEKLRYSNLIEKIFLITLDRGGSLECLIASDTVRGMSRLLGNAMSALVLVFALASYTT